jgi:hypothetical protein
MTLPDDALDEFANTYREWHYLAGGFTLGVLAGIEYARRTLTTQ